MASFPFTDVGPTRLSFPGGDVQQSKSGRMLSLAVAVGANTLYAGSFAGVWRSDDAGENWRQLTWPQPESGIDVDIPGALYVPHIFDLAASPVDPNLVLAAASGGQFTTSRNGIYRSSDGGANWTLVLAFDFVNEIVFAPDDPMLVYAALGSFVAISRNAGQNWDIVTPGASQSALHIAVGPQEAGGVRRVYTAGSGPIPGGQIWYSTDGGNNWSFDKGVETINAARKTVSDFQIACQKAEGIEDNKLEKMPSFAGSTARNNGSGAHILAVEPGNPSRIYLAAVGGSNGPSYYRDKLKDGTLANTVCERRAGEGSLWYGDFSQFSSTKQAVWRQMAGAPLYEGAGNSNLSETPSGNVYVITKATSFGFLVFFSDMNHVHVAQGVPDVTNSWHRLGGKDASESRRDGDNSNIVRVHADPHGLIVTPDFEITLKPASGVSPEYTNNSELDQYIAGRIWMANDGGVYRSDDGGQNWQPATSLQTLDAINIAGLSRPGIPPALYMGTGDNDDFYTLNGGKKWGDPLSLCGDCDAWFADIAQPNRVLQFLPRLSSGDAMRVIESGFPFFGYPDPGDSSQNHFVRRPRESNVSSGHVLRGFRPIIQTLKSETPLADGDYVFITKKVDGSPVLLRTRSISSLKSQAHWDISAFAQQVGPLLPADGPTPDQVIDVVQVGGGHAHPVFYISDTRRLFRLDESLGAWRVIVPGGPPGFSAEQARRFFVDPYHPELIYLLDKSQIKVSGDGGHSWTPDPFLQQALTAAGKMNIQSNSILNDMLFVRDEPFTRFAFGNAGVFCTIDGFHWFTLLNSIAIPGVPESGFFDSVSDPSDRALYVNIEGRSVIRIDGIPAPLVEPPPVYGLLEFAAILEA